MSRTSQPVRPTPEQIAIASSEAALVVDRARIVRSANGLALACFGRPPDEIVGRPVEELFAAAARAPLLAQLDALWMGTVGQESELRLRRPIESSDGEAAPLALSAARVRTAQGPMLRVSLRLVRQRSRRAFAAVVDPALIQARDEWLELLTAGIAHEINNPLTTVLTNLSFATEMLVEDAHDGPALAALRDARVAAERVSKLVREIRMLSRADDVHREPVDVAWVVESALDLASDELRARARIVRELSPTPAVACNAARLSEALLQIFANACDAIPPGDPEANEIAVATHVDEGGEVTIEIRDTGVGIADEDLPFVFAPFFTRKGPRGGPGLGLPICEAIVTAIGGSLEIDSALGAGTTVRLRLPSEAMSSSSPRRAKSSALRLRALRSSQPTARLRKKA